MIIRRPNERHSPAFSTAERPVCVPYKRKAVRLQCRVAAPAASATLNVKTVTIRVFDGRALQGLKFTLCKRSLNFMFDRRLTERHLHNLKQKRESGFAKGYGE